MCFALNNFTRAKEARPARERPFTAVVNENRSRIGTITDKMSMSYERCKTLLDVRGNSNSFLHAVRML